MLDEKTRAAVIKHYQLGQGSIQDIARVYRLTVPEVLEAIGETELLTVQSQGDMIDQSEAGPMTKVNYEGETFTIPFSTD